MAEANPTILETLTFHKTRAVQPTTKVVALTRQFRNFSRILAARASTPKLVLPEGSFFS